MISTFAKKTINEYKYMIFDLDGTLLDSMGVWKDLGFNYLVKNNITSKKDLKDVLKVMTIPQAAEYFINTYKLDKTSEQIVMEIVQMIDFKYKHEIPLKPFAKEYLELCYRNGIKMCVATASDIEYVSCALKRLEVYDLFEAVLSCSEYKIDKNTPDIFNMATEKMGATIEKTIVFEDALHAIKTAKSGGYRVVAVYDEHMQDDYYNIINEADYYINSYKELI